MEEKKMEEVGVVSHFFSKPMVAGIEVTQGEIKVGDTLCFKGHTTGFEQKTESMQIDNQDVQTASKGASVGIKVRERVRTHDKIYKVT